MHALHHRQHHIPEAVPGIRALAHDVRLERHQRCLLLPDSSPGLRARMRLPRGGHAGRRVQRRERTDVDEEEERNDAHGRQGDKSAAPPRGRKRKGSRGWVSLDVVHFGGGVSRIETVACLVSFWRVLGFEGYRGLVSKLSRSADCYRRYSGNQAMR